MANYITSINLNRLYLIIALFILIVSVTGYNTLKEFSVDDKMNMAIQSNLMFHLWYFITGQAPKLLVEFGFEKSRKQIDSNIWLNFVSVALFGFFLWSFYNISMESINEKSFYKLFFIGKPFGMLLGAISLKQYVEKKKLKTPSTVKRQ